MKTMTAAGCSSRVFTVLSIDFCADFYWLSRSNETGTRSDIYGTVYVLTVKKARRRWSGSVTVCKWRS